MKKGRGWMPGKEITSLGSVIVVVVDIVTMVW